MNIVCTSVRDESRCVVRHSLLNQPLYRTNSTPHIHNYNTLYHHL